MTVVIFCILFQVDLLSQVNMWYLGVWQLISVFLCLVTLWIEVGPEVPIRLQFAPQLKPN